MCRFVDRKNLQHLCGVTFRHLGGGSITWKTCGYGSIPIHTIFRGMNIHLPAILMFTRGIGFWPIPMLLPTPAEVPSQTPPSSHVDFRIWPKLTRNNPRLGFMWVPIWDAVKWSKNGWLLGLIIIVLTTCFFVHVQQIAKIRWNSFLPTDTIPSKQRRNNIGKQFPKPSNLYGALSYKPLPLQELFAHCITPNVNPGLINP